MSGRARSERGVLGGFGKPLNDPALARRVYNHVAPAKSDRDQAITEAAGTKRESA